MKLKGNIIVTGGAGYIGSHAIVELYKHGYNPVIIDNLCNSSIKNIQGINEILETEIKWYNVDCTNYIEMKNIFEIEKNIAGCIHFAAFKSVEESVLRPEKYYKNNINSLKVILKCMSNKNIKNFVFSSSCSVYGNTKKLPVDEESPFNKASSPYSETKQICEELLMNNKCSSVSLRYFNPIGSHSSLLIGDCSGDKASNLVTIISDVALGIRKELIVNGNDYDTHDGTCVRDYIHVEDLALAHVNALNYLLENSQVKVAFNVGTGFGLSVLDIVNSFQKKININLPHKIGKRRKGDVAKIFANIDLIKKELNWSPTKTLAQALISSFNWKKNIIC